MSHPSVLVTVYFISSFVSETKGKLTDFPTLISNNGLPSLIYEIFEKYLESWTTTVDVTVETENPQTDFTQRDILNDILGKTMEWKSISLQDPYHLQNDYLRHFNLFVIDSLDSFLRIYSVMNDTAYSRRGYYIIAVTQALPDTTGTVIKLFEYLWAIFIVNVVALRQDIGSSTIYVYTYFPFTQTHCRRVVPVVYNTFDGNKFQQDIPVFPQKLQNLHKCPLNVVTFDYMPYISLEYIGNGRYRTGGIDGKVLDMLSETLNFTVKIQIPKADIPRGLIYKNGTTTGAINMIIEGDGDFTMCGFGYTNQRLERMSGSVIYMSTDMVFAPSIPPPYTAIQRLVFPFKNIVWILVLLSFIFGFFVTTVLKLTGTPYFEFISGYKNRSAMLHMFNVYFGGAVPQTPNRNFARTLLILWITLTIVLRSSYQGAMFQFLQSRQKRVLDLEPVKLVAEGYKIYLMNHWASIAGLMNLKEGEYIIMETDYFKYYNLLLQPGFKGLLVDTNVDVMYYNTLNRSKPLIKPLAKQLYNFPTCIYFKKNSYLVPSFDSVLLNFMGSGLMQKWTNDILNRSYNERPADNPEPKSLTIFDLLGCFYIYGAMVFFSVIVFVLERLTLKNGRLCILIDFYTY